MIDLIRLIELSEFIELVEIIGMIELIELIGLIESIKLIRLIELIDTIPPSVQSSVSPPHTNYVFSKRYGASHPRCSNELHSVTATS